MKNNEYIKYNKTKKSDKKMKPKRLAPFVSNLIYPPTCGICGKLNSNFLCNKCQKLLEPQAKFKIEKNLNPNYYFEEHLYIFEYQGKYEYDPSSVRYEILPGEQELMDNKPVDPSQLHMIAVTCPNCGASYKKAAGYAEKCPYCVSYQNT